VVDIRQTYRSAREEAMMDEARVEFKGFDSAGTPIGYENIMLFRDVVFLVWDRHYSEEERSGGAPVSETFCITGFLRERSGSRFVMSYFSYVKPDKTGRTGGGYLADTGANYQPFTFDGHMQFWKTGEL
jgi:hypothetical protein